MTEGGGEVPGPDLVTLSTGRSMTRGEGALTCCLGSFVGFERRASRVEPTIFGLMVRLVTI